MRKAAKKLISYLYNKEKSIPYYTNNAVTNLVVLILSDGEKYLTKQKVKHNIHFYLFFLHVIIANIHDTSGFSSFYFTFSSFT